MKVWGKLQEDMGTRLHFSTTFHPQTVSQSGRVIQVLEDVLQYCILQFEGSWEKHLPLIKFAYNNNHHLSIKMASYEALYGRRCRTPLYWTGLGEKKLFGIDLVQEQKKKLR